MFQQQTQQQHQPQNNMTLTGQGQIVSGGTVYQMVQTPQGLVAQPIQVIVDKAMVTYEVGKIVVCKGKWLKR